MPSPAVVFSYTTSQYNAFTNTPSSDIALGTWQNVVNTTLCPAGASYGSYQNVLWDTGFNGGDAPSVATDTIVIPSDGLWLINVIIGKLGINNKKIHDTFFDNKWPDMNQSEILINGTTRFGFPNSSTTYGRNLLTTDQRAGGGCQFFPYRLEEGDEITVEIGTGNRVSGLLGQNYQPAIQVIKLFDGPLP